MITIALITILAGLLVGFVTSTRSPTDGLEDLTRNIFVGMGGAFVGLKIAQALSSSTEPSDTSAITLMIAGILGAALILYTVNRIRRA